MTEKKIHSDHTEDLRKQAEKIAWTKADLSQKELEAIQPDEIKQTLHELRVHQIELEMQNEELRLQEVELKASQERYLDLYDLAPVGYFTLSEKRLILESNLTAATLLGITKSNLVNRPLGRFISKEDQDIYFLKCNQLFTTGKPQTVELRMVKKDGTEFWAHLDAITAKDAGGATVCRVVMSDINEKKRVEETLRESQELFSLFMQHSPVYTFIKEVTPPESRVLQASDNFEQMIGIPGLKMPGKTMADLFPPEFAAKMTNDDWTVVSNGHVLEQDEELNGRYYTTIKFPIVQRGKTLLAGYSIDITERKQAEEALAKSEEKFRKAFYTSPDSININRLEDGVYISINPGFTKIMGYTEADIIGKAPIEYHIWDRIEDRQNLLAGLKKDWEVINIEAAFRTKGGGIRYGLMSASIIDLNGVPHILSITRDITNRKQAEDALRESEEKYRRITDNMSDIVAEMDAQGIIKYISPSHQRIFGENHEAQIGKSAFDPIHPEDRDRVMAEYMESVRTKTDREVECRYRHVDGHYIWIRSLSHFLFDTVGELAGMIVSISDISDRKRAEEKLRLTQFAIDNTSDAVFWTNPDGRIVDVNEAACRLLGYTHDELLQCAVPDIDPKFNAETWSQRFAEICKQGSLSIESYQKNKDGRLISVAITTNYIPFGDKEFVCAFVRDITIRKKTEEALRESEARYRELSTVDSLTSLYNSRHFYVQLKNETERSSRYSQPLTLLLLDLDNFKAFNDTYGHVEGDEVLSRLGQVVKRCLRQMDSAYRYGGEEFTIILPMATSKVAAISAERIRTELKKEIFSPALDREVHITLSIGLAQYRPQEDMKAFVHRVDQLMYQAKKNGKDRIYLEA